MMAAPARRLLAGVAVAIVLGFLLGWFARSWLEHTPESRLREAADLIRERIHELTH